MSDFSDALAEQAERNRISYYEQASRPFHLLRPRVFPDGDSWIVLYGENLQEGISGVGATPDIASYDFDNNFFAQKLPIRAASGGAK